MDAIRYSHDNPNLATTPAKDLNPGETLTGGDRIESEVEFHSATIDQCDFKHPPFNQSIRVYIEQIQAAFAEHYPISFEEWENGFRRDENAAQQIAVWWYAADVYKEFAGNESSEQRRADIYRCVFCCMTSNRDTIGDIYQPHAISRSEAKRIEDRYFMVTPHDPAYEDA